MTDTPVAPLPETRRRRRSRARFAMLALLLSMPFPFINILLEYLDQPVPERRTHVQPMSTGGRIRR